MVKSPESAFHHRIGTVMDPSWFFDFSGNKKTLEQKGQVVAFDHQNQSGHAYHKRQLDEALTRMVQPTRFLAVVN